MGCVAYECYCKHDECENNMLDFEKSCESCYTEIELISLQTVHGVHNRRNIIGLKGCDFLGQADYIQ